MADIAAATGGETLKQVRALLGSGKKISASAAQELTLALLADMAEAQQHDREQIEYIKKKSIGVFIDRHRTIAILIAVLVMLTLEIAPDVTWPLVAKALGIPTP